MKNQNWYRSYRLFKLQCVRELVKLFKKMGMVALLLAAAAPARVALAADDGDSKAQFTVGLKVWNSSWLSYNPNVYSGVGPDGQFSLADSVDAVEGGTRTDAIPVIGVRKGNMVFSFTHASYATDFHTPRSSVIGPGGQNITTSRTDHLARKETDLVAAYFVLPNIALSAGLKHASESRDSSTGLSARTRFLNAKGKAILIGALATFPIKHGLNAYGQLGYGPTRLTTTLPDGSGSDTSNGRYLSSELGVSYALQMADPFVKGLFVGLGYRSQTIRTPGIAAAYGDARDYRDVKDGVVFSVTVAL